MMVQNDRMGQLIYTVGLRSHWTDYKRNTSESSCQVTRAKETSDSPDNPHEKEVALMMNPPIVYLPPIRLSLRPTSPCHAPTPARSLGSRLRESIVRYR